MRKPNQELRNKALNLRAALRRAVIGCDRQVEMIILALLSGGHVSALGEPGTGKTYTLKCLALSLMTDEQLDVMYKRLTMVPDMMPADIQGTEIRGEDGSFKFLNGPLNSNVIILHADEINRTLPRTQSALLEPMEEGQFSTAGITSRTTKLDKRFMLAATRNPLEQEGVCPLPAAQLDRFCCEVIYPLPTEEQMAQIADRAATGRHNMSALERGLISVDDILPLRQDIAESTHWQSKASQYASRLVCATRPQVTKELEEACATGASVRAAEWTLTMARAKAYLEGSDVVTADHIQFVFPDVIRHRLILKDTAAYSKGKWTTDKVIETVIKSVQIPN